MGISHGLGAWIRGGGLSRKGAAETLRDEDEMPAVRLPVTSQAPRSIVGRSAQNHPADFTFENMKTPPGERVMTAGEKSWRSELIPGYGLQSAQVREEIIALLYEEEPPMMRATGVAVPAVDDEECLTILDTDSISTLEEGE